MGAAGRPQASSVRSPAVGGQEQDLAFALFVRERHSQKPPPTVRSAIIKPTSPARKEVSHTAPIPRPEAASAAGAARSGAQHAAHAATPPTVSA